MFLTKADCSRRKLLWYKHLGRAGWPLDVTPYGTSTYDFSENSKIHDEMVLTISQNDDIIILPQAS